MPTLTDLRVDYVSLVDRAAVRDPINQSDPMRFVLFKRDYPTPQGGSMTPEEQKAALEKAQADLTAATARADAAEAQVAKADEKIEALTKSVEELQKAAGKEPEPKPIDKSDLPPAVREALEKAEEREAAANARIEKAEKAAEDADRLAKAERDARLTREFVTKAETFKCLPVKAADFGPVLKSVSEKLTKDEAAELDRVLAAADAAMTEAGLFEEQGRAREGDTPTTAVAQAKAAAAEIRKNDTSLSESAAMQQAFKADPALAARYQDEVRGQ